ncbi:hypothetical protein J41TS4_39710 [Paenibacillus apis]|uniref:Uncharacterized protein n=1 Tax=Paenibacillus apis TaxID=1792174 RepID=A0A919Y6N2_9BACL|nr:hypothetical protein J41TS4_39710 [Paenibacillus apis]
MGCSPIEYSRVLDKRSEKVKQTEKPFPMKENHQRRQIMALCGPRCFLSRLMAESYNKSVRSNKVKERGMCDV